MSTTPRTDSQPTFCDGNGDERVWVPVDFARQIESELTEARAELAKRQWQPIETAPRDKWFDVWAGKRLADCFFRGGVVKTNSFLPNGDWGEVTVESEAGQLPTHWMPLPEAPTEKLSTGDNDLG